MFVCIFIKDEMGGDLQSPIKGKDNADDDDDLCSGEHDIGLTEAECGTGDGEYESVIVNESSCASCVVAFVVVVVVVVIIGVACFG